METEEQHKMGKALESWRRRMGPSHKSIWTPLDWNVYST